MFSIERETIARAQLLEIIDTQEQKIEELLEERDKIQQLYYYPWNIIKSLQDKICLKFDMYFNVIKQLVDLHDNIDDLPMLAQLDKELSKDQTQFKENFTKLNTERFHITEIQVNSLSKQVKYLEEQLMKRNTETKNALIDAELDEKDSKLMNVIKNLRIENHKLRFRGKRFDIETQTTFDLEEVGVQAQDSFFEIASSRIPQNCLFHKEFQAMIKSFERCDSFCEFDDFVASIEKTSDLVVSANLSLEQSLRNLEKERAKSFFLGKLKSMNADTKAIETEHEHGNNGFKLTNPKKCIDASVQVNTEFDKLAKMQSEINSLYHQLATSASLHQIELQTLKTRLVELEKANAILNSSKLNVTLENAALLKEKNDLLEQKVLLKEKNDLLEQIKSPSIRSPEQQSKQSEAPIKIVQIRATQTDQSVFESKPTQTFQQVLNTFVQTQDISRHSTMYTQTYNQGNEILTCENSTQTIFIENEKVSGRTKSMDNSTQVSTQVSNAFIQTKCNETETKLIQTLNQEPNQQLISRFTMTIQEHTSDATQTETLSEDTELNQAEQLNQSKDNTEQVGHAGSEPLSDSFSKTTVSLSSSSVSLFNSDEMFQSSFSVYEQDFKKASESLDATRQLLGLFQ